MMQRRSTRWAAGLVGLGAIALVTSGCAGVEPWQRGTLAQRCMQVAPAPEREAARQHVLAVREGATTSTGAAGGGCGCD